MKRDKDNIDLAKGVDVLAPEGYGEIVGGGERETNLDLLIEKMKRSVKFWPQIRTSFV